MLYWATFKDQEEEEEEEEKREVNEQKIKVSKKSWWRSRDEVETFSSSSHATCSLKAIALSLFCFFKLLFHKKEKVRAESGVTKVKG